MEDTVKVETFTSLKFHHIFCENGKFHWNEILPQETFVLTRHQSFLWKFIFPQKGNINGNLWKCHINVNLQDFGFNFNKVKFSAKFLNFQC